VLSGSHQAELSRESITTVEAEFQAEIKGLLDDQGCLWRPEDRESIEKSEKMRARFKKICEAEKIALYQLADIFVMPGFGEGFGFVYLEALACGLPVIGSKLDGSREALRDGQLGILVNPHDPKEIISALLQLLNKEKLKFIPEGLYYFSYPCFYQRLENIIARFGKHS